jgi:hypothetical protein
MPISAVVTPMITSVVIKTALRPANFTVYNIMAALVFNHVFFPSFDPLVGTILAFSTCA